MTAPSPANGIVETVQRYRWFCRRCATYSGGIFTTEEDAQKDLTGHLRVRHDIVKRDPGYYMVTVLNARDRHERRPIYWNGANWFVHAAGPKVEEIGMRLPMLDYPIVRMTEEES